MAERPTPEAFLADVLTRRFAPSGAADATLARLTRALAQDHVALEVDEEDRAALAGEARLCEPHGVADAVADAGPPLVLVAGRYLYPRRLAAAEQRVATLIRAARAGEVDPPGGVDPGALDAAAAAVVGELSAAGTPAPDLVDVARRSLTRRVSFLTGGPGTGKTWLAARVLRVLDRALAESGGTASVALAAPTGKAARRLSEVADEMESEVPLTRVLRDRTREGSLHRLLGASPDRPGHFTPIHHDVVVVDEVSMADLPILDLLARASSTTPSRLVLVGDPDQLVSVTVGAVLADVVRDEAGDAALLTRLDAVHRTDRRSVLDLADAVRRGDAARARAALSGDGAELIAPSRVEGVLADADDAAALVAQAARRGDAAGALTALRAHVVLCAHREGPLSVAWWNATLRARARRRDPAPPGESRGAGDPLLVTRNQPALGLSNGDLGVVVDVDGQRRVCFDAGRSFPVGAVGFTEPAWALTVHKAQGSEFDRVAVVLPDVGSPLLTRQLLYTGVTRARSGVAVVATEAALAAAIATEVERVSGLTWRLGG
ncbi:MAG TPA: AAA family ATPase [Acidimicrobiales bacterium]|nr:AAA family ATPase [Acidimicrobiales bacterium]